MHSRLKVDSITHCKDRFCETAISYRIQEILGLVQDEIVILESIRYDGLKHIQLSETLEEMRKRALGGWRGEFLFFISFLLIFVFY